MLTSNALALLRVLRRWSVGSVDKFAQEMHLDHEPIEKAAEELLHEHFITAFDMDDGSVHHQNKMLEISAKGIFFLENLDGPVSTFQDKT